MNFSVLKGNGMLLINILNKLYTYKYARSL